MDWIYKSNYILSILLVHVNNIALCCIFPVNLHGQVWYTNIRTTVLRRTAVHFRGSIMEQQDEQTDTRFIFNIAEFHCITMVDIGKYIVNHTSVSGKEYFSCLQFVNRSKSIIQLRESDQVDKPISALCREHRLQINPWLLVSYSRMKREFVTCPLSGGYNLKIKDSLGNEHGCNRNDLPMRFESECITGEGITFNFRSANCLATLPMDVVQTTLCITNWRLDGDVFIVLRKYERDELWCLRIPARSSYTRKMHAYLYTDLACVSETSQDKSAVNYTLELDMVPQGSLCEDEHKNCASLPCNSYVKSQCPRSCNLCDPNATPTFCTFPRKMRGDWVLRDQFGLKIVNVTDTNFHIDEFGTFRCVVFPDSPPRDRKLFTTMSLFQNGCRPRFTCLGLHKFSSSVIGFSISKSYIWPMKGQNYGSRICSQGRFQLEAAPVLDTYRSYRDVYKPILTRSNEIRPQSCTLISSYLINATFTDGETCDGYLYQDCGNSSRIRIEFSRCWSAPKQTDFMCVAVYKGHYWERIILMENMADPDDVRCLMFSEVEINRALMLVGSQCDKYGWTYSNANMREPLIRFQLTMEDPHCRDITTAHMPINDAHKDDSALAKSKQNSEDGKQVAPKPSKKTPYFVQGLLPDETRGSSVNSKDRRNSSNQNYLNWCLFVLIFVLHLNYSSQCACADS